MNAASIPLINPRGSRWWRFRYTLNGKERGISFGVYPDVPLALARKRLDEARQLVADGIDPSHKRQSEKRVGANTFKAIAKWLALQQARPAPITFSKAKRILKHFIYPRIGDQPIAKITACDLLAALRKTEACGTHETAHRAKQRCGQIFRYAIATGRGGTRPLGALTWRFGAGRLGRKERLRDWLVHRKRREALEGGKSGAQEEGSGLDLCCRRQQSESSIL